MDKIEELLMGVPEEVYATAWGREAVEELKRLRDQQPKQAAGREYGQVLVRWEVDVFGASTVEDAARKAQMYQRNPFSIATVFEVTDAKGQTFRVDLQELDEGRGDRDAAGQLAEILDKCAKELADDPICAVKFAELMREFEKRFRDLYEGELHRMVSGGERKRDFHGYVQVRDSANAPWRFVVSGFDSTTSGQEGRCTLLKSDGTKE
jgi:hypothetical protein